MRREGGGWIGPAFGLTFALCVTGSVLYLLSRLSQEATTLLIGALVVAISGAIVGVPIVALAFLLSRRERLIGPERGAAVKSADPYTELMQREYQERRYALLMRKLDEQERRMQAQLPEPAAAGWSAAPPPSTTPARSFVVLGDDDEA